MDSDIIAGTRGVGSQVAGMYRRLNPEGRVYVLEPPARVVVGAGGLSG